MLVAHPEWMKRRLKGAIDRAHMAPPCKTLAAVAPSGPSTVHYACGYRTLQTGLFVASRFLLDRSNRAIQRDPPPTGHRYKRICAYAGEQCVLV
jgi:hypothetical protein